jgi:diacylglycerol O-acyltransferase
VKNPERMTRFDTTLLRMESPTNRMIITVVLTLAGPVDVSQVVLSLADPFLFRRFQQRVEHHDGRYWWCDDPDFDPLRHFERIRLPRPAGKPELVALVSELASRPLDRMRPLWHVHIVDDYDAGIAIIIRVHHAIADGMALMGILLSLATGSAAEGLRSPDVPPPSEAAGATGTRSLRNQVRRAAGIAAEAARATFRSTDSPSRFKGVASIAKRAAWSEPLDFAEVRARARALGCSGSAVLFAGVTGALRRYLEEKGDSTVGAELRVIVPVNLRPSGDEPALGNRVGSISVLLPLGMDDPSARVREVHRRLSALKGSYEPSFMLSAFNLLGHAPHVIQRTVLPWMSWRATAIMTMVPGPRGPLYFAGAQIKQTMFWAPAYADLGMGLSILIFNGEVTFGLMAHAALVPDPERIVSLLNEEFLRQHYGI